MPTTLQRDLSFALRGFRRAPRFAAAAVVTLALAVGTATTVFSLVQGVLLRPLPYGDPDRLVMIWNDLGDGAQSLPAVSTADFLDYPRETRLFEDFAAGSGGGTVGATGILTGAGEAPEKVDVSAASANFFSLLGVRPALGRAFTVEEERFNGPRVVVLSHALWRRRYGADPALVGRTIELDGVAHTVVGVLPADFRLYLPAERFLINDAAVWKPLQVNLATLPPRNFTGLTVFGRLKQGVTLAQAQREMDAVAERFRATHAEHRASNLRIRAVPLQEDVVKGVRPTLLLLLAAVGLVVVIACANVANLLLARATAREQELAVRFAMGASRGAVVRQLMTESLALAVVGGALGLALAGGALAAIRRFLPVDLPRLDEVRVDWVVLAFTAGVCLLTALLFGLAPALHGARGGLAAMLRGAGRVAGHGRQARLRHALIVGEVALSLVLLVSAGLLVRSFGALQEVRPGFRPEGALTFRVWLPGPKYGPPESRRAFVEELERRLAALPGVTSVGAVSQLPLTGSGPLSPYAYDEETARNWESVTADGRVATGRYFEAVGAQLVAGRFFLPSDDRRTAPVIIVDETLARRAFPNGDAVGRQLQVQPSGAPNQYATVVGVVRHLRLHDLAADVRGQIYLPFYRVPFPAMSFVVRADGDPTRLAPLVRREVTAMDAQLPVTDLLALDAYVGRALDEARFALALMQIVGGLALALAVVGIYGVVSYTVAQRTREFGVRLALGETPGGLTRRVVRDGLRLIVPAVALGVLAAAASTRGLGRFLYGVDAHDPVTFAVAAGVLTVVAVAACWGPARRAAGASPMAALRAE